MPARKQQSTSSDPFGQQLAICLWDLERVPPDMMDKLRPALDLRRESVVRINEEKDREDRYINTAIPFRCSLLQAAMACDVIRANDRRFGDQPCRVYLLRDGKWRRLVNDAVLSVVDGGQVQLNPAIFKVIS